MSPPPAGAAPKVAPIEENRKTVKDIVQQKLSQMVRDDLPDIRQYFRHLFQFSWIMLEHDFGEIVLKTNVLAAAAVIPSISKAFRIAAHHLIPLADIRPSPSGSSQSFS
jgi:hypothetical protein